MKSKLETKVIKDFGEEWKTYNQSTLSLEEIKKLFNNYFKIFPFNLIDKNSIGFDMGCGSGRWATLIAPKVKKLTCIEPSSKAIQEAKENLNDHHNCFFEHKSVFDNSLPLNSQDFGYCLGVLHHINDTQAGLNECVKKLKKGAPFLLYLYYKFDNKPIWYKKLWEISNIFRLVISKMPFKLKLYMTNFIGVFIYFPLAKASLFIERFGLNINNFPLSSYRDSSLYTMKTDALDRFGTKIEQRFTKNEIQTMMQNSGLQNINFSKDFPFWVAIGFKK